MTDFKIHTKDSAPADSKPTLEAVEKKFGFIPNVIGGLAESPGAVKAYATLSGIFGESSLDATEQHVVLLTVSRLHECDYCMAAHSTSAEKRKIPREIVEALRSGGEISDERLEALHKFTALMVEKRGALSDDEIKAFIDAGFTRAQVLEVIVGVAMKTISNYGNHLMETPVDAVFQAKVWKKAS